eukprot:TRINITY_DN8027_c0_g1_i1.p1 TRINITY_DN8027_c0_g1~~TRINITY_DN8027_c0_g1_i1.p1  ORF type:complete len:157 (+),score=24.23 TRINITY_DN8027_c0_g1_i1:279-749(+)
MTLATFFSLRLCLPLPRDCSHCRPRFSLSCFLLSSLMSLSSYFLLSLLPPLSLYSSFFFSLNSFSSPLSPSSSCSLSNSTSSSLHLLSPIRFLLPPLLQCFHLHIPPVRFLLGYSHYLLLHYLRPLPHFPLHYQFPLSHHYSPLVPLPHDFDSSEV